MRFFNFIIIAFLLFALTSCAPTRNLEEAPEGVQSISLWHKGSGERIGVVYRSGGKYVPEAMRKIDYIFRDRHTDEVYPIDPELIDLVAGLRDRMALPPDTEIEVLSGYRSPETNANIAKTNKYVAKQSYHMKGKAVDIRIPGMVGSVLEHVARSQQRGGVALYPDSGHVHVDTGPVRGWSIKRGQEDGMRRAAAKAQHFHARTSAPRDTTYRVPLKARDRMKQIEDSYSDLPSVPSAAPKKQAPTKVAKPATKPAAKSVPSSKDLKKDLEKAKKQWVKPVMKKPAAPAKKPAAKVPAKTTPHKN